MYLLFFIYNKNQVPSIFPIFDGDQQLGKALEDTSPRYST